MAGHGAVKEVVLAEDVPISLLIELSAGGGERCSEQGPEFLITVDAELTEADGEVDILDGDEVGIKSADCFACFSSGPEGAKGDFEFCEIERNDGSGHEDPRRPALRKDHGSAADVFSALKLSDDILKHARVEAAVSIDSDDDVAISGIEAGISDAGEVLGFFGDESASGALCDFGSVISAAVENDDCFNVTRAEYTGFFDGGEAIGEKFFLVVRGNDDRDFDAKKVRWIL